MRVLKAQLYNEKNDAMTNIELPASFEELENALQVVNGVADECATDIIYFLNNMDLLENKTVKPCNLYELNYFAQIISGLDEDARCKFSGILEITCQSEYPEISEMINLALNTEKLNCLLAPASNDHDLGEFYVENQLIDELADLDSVSDKEYEWICSHLDIGKIGQEIRENEGGAFVNNGYMVISEVTKSLYNGTPVVPAPKDYVFLLELALLPTGDAPNDEQTISLELPASDTEIENVLSVLGAEDMSDCCFYEYESTVIPQLSEVYGDTNDFDALNQLAGQISKFDANTRVKFKAMLEAVDCQSIDTAIRVCENMDSFSLHRNLISPADYVDRFLEQIDIPMKEELNFYLSKDGYGRCLMQQAGVEETPYGMIIPDNGLKLSEQIQKQNEDMELTMSM